MAESSYEVGYGKPPVAKRFQKGQSGNPKGRPRKPIKSDSEIWEKIMHERIVVRENGMETEMSYREAILKAMRMKALKGNTRAMTMTLNLNKQVLDVARNGGRRSATDAVIEAIQKARFEAVMPKPSSQTSQVSNDT